MNCPNCGRTMEITAADGDGMGAGFENFECQCGFEMERQTHTYISKFKIPQPVLKSHMDTIAKFFLEADADKFERIWGSEDGKRFWEQLHTKLANNWMKFWIELDRKNKDVVLNSMNRVGESK